MPGTAVGSFFGFKYEGVYQNTEQATGEGLYIDTPTGGRSYFQAGDMRFIDLDGNKVINDADKCIIGDPNPDLYGNIFTTLSWKRFSLSAVFNYSLGNDIYNYQRSLLEGGSLFLNQTTAMNNRWNTEG